jgi:hypothetical protein
VGAWLPQEQAQEQAQEPPQEQHLPAPVVIEVLYSSPPSKRYLRQMDKFSRGHLQNYLILIYDKRDKKRRENSRYTIRCEKGPVTKHSKKNKKCNAHVYTNFITNCFNFLFNIR